MSGKRCTREDIPSLEKWKLDYSFHDYMPLIDFFTENILPICRSPVNISLHGFFFRKRFFGTKHLFPFSNYSIFSGAFLFLFHFFAQHLDFSFHNYMPLIDFFIDIVVYYSKIS